MATITQTTPNVAEDPKFDLDVAGWLRSTVFDSIWKVIAVILLILINVVIVRTTFNADPVGLSFNLAPNGQPTGLGSAILAVTNAPFLTLLVLVLWLVGAAAVIYGAGRHSWPGPVRWLKESLYGGLIGSLVTLALSLLVVFTVRALLSWAIFGAEFRADAEQVTILKELTPGAVWGVVGANAKLFAVGRYPAEVLWRPWASLGIVLGLGVLSLLAWNFGSPLKDYRRWIVWGWLASIIVILLILQGIPGQEAGAFQEVTTTLWGGLLLTLVISVIGILFSFPIGVVMALGRRSETRGVPLLWLWGGAAMFIYWGIFGFPAEETALTIPVLFRDPPVWNVTLSPIGYAALQAFIVVGICWAVGYYLKGNLIQTLSVVYIEVIRGVPLITVLFMANVMLPIFLPKNLEINNLLRVIIGVILFTAAYMAENVRGGLQAIPKGQYEAAAAVGLTTAQSMRLVVLPQALRAVIPAIVGMCISLFKDTSLVALVGLFDLLNIARVVVAQPDWLGLRKETFAFVALVYWVFAFAMSRASQRLEKKLGVGQY